MMSDGEAAGVVIALILLMALIIIVACAPLLAALWKMFEKMGEPGWKALIPVYNGYILYKMTWRGSMYWVTLGLTVAMGVAYFVMESMSDSNLVLFWILFALYMIIWTAFMVIWILAAVNCSMAFGQGGGFAIGLILLNYIFYLILGFDDSEYIGPSGEGFWENEYEVNY